MHRSNINESLKTILIEKIEGSDSSDSSIKVIVDKLVSYLSEDEIKKYIGYHEENNTLAEIILSIKRHDLKMLDNLIDNLSTIKLKKYVKTIGEGNLYNDNDCKKTNSNWKLPPTKTSEGKCCNEAYPGEGKKKCIDGFKKENSTYLDGIDKPDSKETGTAGKFDLNLGFL